jgi:hypothetical protein
MRIPGNVRMQYATPFVRANTLLQGTSQGRVQLAHQRCFGAVETSKEASMKSPWRQEAGGSIALAALRQGLKARLKAILGTLPS